MELMIVASLCAVVFTSGSLAFRAISKNQRRTGTFQEVSLTANVASNFFPGTTATVIDSYTAPNYGRAALAQQMRNLFHEDVESASAVFPLARVGNINSIRERVISVGNIIPAACDTPEKFLQLLLATPSTATRAAVFRTYRGAPPDSVTSGSVTTFLTNGSVFILQPSGGTTELWTRAVYEIDYIPYTDAANNNTPSVHASVRRYVNDVLTNYYDIVYNDSTLAQVGIPFVHFERALRANVSESTVTPYKAAINQPFYMMWWPDPSMPTLKGTALGTYTGLRQADYAKHEGQTSFTFVFPQFPCF